MPSSAHQPGGGELLHVRSLNPLFIEAGLRPVMTMHITAPAIMSQSSLHRGRSSAYWVFGPLIASGESQSSLHRGRSSARVGTRSTKPRDTSQSSLHRGRSSADGGGPVGSPPGRSQSSLHRGRSSAGPVRLVSGGREAVVSILSS